MEVSQQMNERGTALDRARHREGFGVRDLMARVHEMLKDPETLLTLARLGGAAAGERDPVQLDAFARSLVLKTLAEERGLDGSPGGAEGRYGPEVMAALAAKGLASAEGRTLVRLEAMAAGQSLERALLPEAPAAGQARLGFEPAGRERLEAWAADDLGAMRDALLGGHATPEQMGEALRRIDGYRQALGEERFAELLAQVFGEEAGQLQGWLDFRAAFVAGKKEYWYRVIEQGEAAAGEWDQEHYQPLRDQRDAGLKDATYGALVQAIQNEAVGVHEAYAALSRAKAGWWEASLSGRATEPFAAAGAAARERLAQVDPLAERLWGASNAWHRDGERAAEVGQFKAAYEQLMQGLIAGDAAAVAQANQALASVPTLFGTAPHMELWRQYEGPVKEAYLKALGALGASPAGAERSAAEQHVDLFRQSLQPELLQEWERLGQERATGPIQAQAYTTEGDRVMDSVPYLLQMPLPPGTYSNTSPPGIRVHPIKQTETMHYGTDYGAASGVPVRAAHGGEVLEAGWSDGYGNYVVLKGPGGVYTRYAHMEKAPAVKPGQSVEPGTLLGSVGSTGMSTGPHLHFEIWRFRDDGTKLYFAADDVCALQQGSTGKRVRELQQRLHDHGYGERTGAVDGIFGQRTADAVKAFQRDRGLAETGIVDADTLQALAGAPQQRPEAHRLHDLSPGIDGIIEGWRMLYGLTPEEEMAVRIAATFEGSSARGFDLLTGNFDGQGVSFGFAQWNLGQGTLQSQILRPLLKSHPDVFYRHFPDGLTIEVNGRDYTMAQIVSLEGSELRAVFPEIGRQVSDPANPWHQAFKGLAREEECMRLQLASAKRMLDLAKQEMTSAYYLDSQGNKGPAKSWTVSSPAGLALLYDVRKQNGSFGNVWGEIESGLIGREPASETGLLKYLAWHVANGSRSQYKSDVWSRKVAIAEGGGVVHSTRWEFDWAAARVLDLGGAKNPVFPQQKDPRDFLSE